MTADVSRETPDELEVIASTRLRVVDCLGEKLEVRPLTVGQLPRFAKAVRPLIGALNEVLPALDAPPAGEDAPPAEIAVIDIDKVVTLIEEHGDQLIAAVAAATGQSEDRLAAAPLDEFTELVLAVFAINLDFFVQRLLPGLARNVSAFAGQLRVLRGSGRTPSSSSSIAGTH